MVLSERESSHISKKNLRLKLNYDTDFPDPLKLLHKLNSAPKTDSA